MTQRIGTGANAQLTQYAAGLSTTPRQLETTVPVGGAVGALTSQSPSTSVVRSLATGPVNPGRLYVQGLTIFNADAAITVYLTTDASGVAAVAFPITAGSSFPIDMSRGDQIFLFAASGTPTVRVVGN